MAKGDRVPLKQKFGKWKALDDDNWNALEDIMGSKFSPHAREQVEVSCGVFAVFGELHGAKNTILFSDAKSSIQAWARSGKKLQTTLGRKAQVASPNRKAALAKHLPHLIIGYQKHDVPLHYLANVVALAIDSALQAIREIDVTRAAMRKDLWSAWVARIEKTLTCDGIKVSASSTSKTQNTSPFVKLISELQDRLPASCRRRNSEESLVQAINRSRRTMGKLTDKALMAILAGYGSQLMTAYPGRIEKKLPDDMYSVETSIQEDIIKQVQAVVDAAKTI